jgi:hypothetical protein
MAKRVSINRSLQHPRHPLHSAVIGLLVDSGWEVAYTEDSQPFIRHVSGQYPTFNTWWDCLRVVIGISTDPAHH